MGGIEARGTFERGGDLAARGETVFVVAGAGSGGGVHEAAGTALPLRRRLLFLRPGGGDGDASRGEGERPLVTCRVGKEKKPLAFCPVYFYFLSSNKHLPEGQCCLQFLGKLKQMMMVGFTFSKE